jgi:hypothetical protein
MVLIIGTILLFLGCWYKSIEQLLANHQSHSRSFSPENKFFSSRSVAGHQLRRCRSPRRINSALIWRKVGTSRCDVPARAEQAERVAVKRELRHTLRRWYAARTAQRAVPTNDVAECSL